ncbi:MAG: cytochrome b5 domain-containing protein [Candidatus Pacebacteria bacterium]|nr:cytochrome b5 domain-containing protein [Candidatus Paceibacterota bacterium]PIR60378.1 MAG: hypothetical protein COU67_02380 [Candidatus Pacebacteria bacterium CG10_big_fil_rev_8_21_14_0_10_44_54]
MSLSRFALFGSVAVLTAVVSGCSLLPQKDSPAEAPTDAAMEAPAAGDAMEKIEEVAGDSAMMDKTFTLEEVAMHATPEDCYLAIEGKVYDVTEFIASEKHPGGEAIFFGCGKDATEMFNNRQSDSKPHSEQARSFLPNFYIGELAQ